MALPLINTESVLAFTFTFLRMSAVLFTIPVLGETSVPARVKAGLALVVSMIVFSAIGADMPHLEKESNMIAIGVAMIGEVFIGVILGFAARIIFAGIQFAGDTIGMQMGFSIVNVIDPISSTQVSIMAEFQYMIALMVYLAVDAHHLFIMAAVDSYRIVAPLNYHFSGPLMQTLLVYSKELFVIAIKISAPVMAVLLFTNVALAVIARTIPQLNIFIVGMPLQIAAGLIVTGLAIPVTVKLMEAAFGMINTELHTLLKLM
jgi:flagellar biosynthesis protein FliR